MSRARVLKSGDRFGRLTVLRDRVGGEYKIPCRCDCGTEVDVIATGLGRNRHSCGCLKRGETNGRWAGGKARHPLYETYHDMVGRCTRPTHLRWASYGGRGITVCQRWQDDFWNFVADMGDRPDGRSLDRTNNDLGYSPENCRWATDSEQANNRRPMPRPAECKAGHKHTEENTRITPDGKQRCRTCERKWAADRRARLADAA